MGLDLFVPHKDSRVSYGEIVTDRWVVGGGADSISEYVMHLAEPRFVAKFWDVRKNVMEEPSLVGLSISGNYGVFYDIIWLDYEPDTNECIYKAFW